MFDSFLNELHSDITKRGGSPLALPEGLEEKPRTLVEANTEAFQGIGQGSARQQREQGRVLSELAEKLKLLRFYFVNTNYD